MKNIKTSIAALAFATILPTLAYSQDTTTQDPARAETRSDHRDYGWLGLLGLIGLVGLKRRDHQRDSVRDRDRVAVNTR